MKHTPGTWFVNTEAGTPYREVFGDVDGGSLIADCGCGPTIWGTDEMLANAHLIAAAPDLLEACKFIVEDLAIGTEGYSLVKSAIKKAEGQP